MDFLIAKQPWNLVYVSCFPSTGRGFGRSREGWGRRLRSSVCVCWGDRGCVWVRCEGREGTGGGLADEPPQLLRGLVLLLGAKSDQGLGVPLSWAGTRGRCSPQVGWGLGCN